MQLPEFTYLKPETLQEGLDLLERSNGSAMLIAGGTDVLYNMKLGLFTPETLISIKHLPELHRLEEDEDGTLIIGASCRLSDLVVDPLISERYPALRDGIQAVASKHVRNMASLGGNLCLETRCWYTNQSHDWRDSRVGCFKTDGDVCHVIKSSPDCHALNSSDSAPILMAMEAQVILVSARGQRIVPLQKFYRPDGLKHTVMEPDEIMREIRIPPCNDRLLFKKVAPRQGLDYAQGVIAVRAGGKGKKVSSLTMILGSLATSPIILNKCTQIILTSGLSDAAIDRACEASRDELGALVNLYTKAAHKRELAKALIKKALIELRGM